MVDEPEGPFACCAGCVSAWTKAVPKASDGRLTPPDPSHPGLAGWLKDCAEVTRLAEAVRGSLPDYFVRNLLVMKGRHLPFAARKEVSLARAFVADGWRCAYCRDPLDGTVATVDHDVPLKRGGADDGTNVVWACVACNTLKSALTGAEFRAMLLDEDPPPVPSILAAHGRFRRNEGLDLGPVERGWAAVTGAKPCREDVDWSVGEPVTQWDLSGEGGPRPVDVGVVVSYRSHAGAREHGLAEVRTWGRAFTVYTATFREKGLPFDDTLSNRRRWLPDRVADAMSRPRLAAVLSEGKKAGYMTRFVTFDGEGSAMVGPGPSRELPAVGRT